MTDSNCEPLRQRRFSLNLRLERLEVVPDARAKVVVDERTGTVVMGEKVRISTVAVANGALSISVTERPQVSQALPLAQGGKTTVVPRTQVRVGEQKTKLALVKRGASIGDVVNACLQETEFENRMLKDYIHGVTH